MQLAVAFSINPSKKTENGGIIGGERVCNYHNKLEAKTEQRELPGIQFQNIVTMFSKILGCIQHGFIITKGRKQEA
jgi:hypothetical protein